MPLDDSIRNTLESYGIVRDDFDEFPIALGYETQVDQLVDHIEKSAKKSLILMGESGVGKSTILREAFRLLSYTGWSVVETSTAEIMRGTSYLGEWQTRTTQLADIASADLQVLIYVTDIHNLRDTGKSSASKDNMADALMPYLQRGDIVLVGECTPETFRHGFESSPTLQRQVSVFRVPPVEKEKAREILHSAYETIRSEFESTCGCSLELSAVTLTSLEQQGGIYFPSIAQPGASIELLRKVVESKRREVDAITSKKRPAVVDLTQGDIVNTLHEISGLPVHLLDDRIPLDLKKTREFFDTRIIGQNEAVTTVIDIVTLVKAGLTDPGKPTSIMMFAGPTGVGKTELAKALAEFLFGSPDRMIRCDMSEYKDYHSYEKFIGAKRDENDSTSLISQVRRQPFSVILLDEVEKANPNIFDVLLQAFDDGRLTDAQGNTGDLTQTIIIMTSNLGSDLSAPPPVGFDSELPDSSELVGKALRNFFRPEFLNRIDHIVRFQPLKREDIRTLAKRELGKALLRNGIVRRELRVTVDPEVHDLLAEKGYDAKFGARPLRRQVEKLAILPVAREIIALEETDKGSLLRLQVKEGAIDVNILADRQTHTARRIAGGVPVEDPLHGTKKKIRPSDLAETLKKFEGHIEALEDRSDEEELVERKSELLALSGKADFWDDQARAREVLSDIYRLERLIEAIAKSKQRHEALTRQLEAIQRNPTESAFKKLALDLRSLGHFVELVRFAMECQDREDRRDTFIAIRLVDESSESDLVFKLAETYRQWATRMQYGCRVIHEEEANATCLREVVLEISGPAAHGIFHGEEGEHEFVFGKTSRQPRRNRFVSVRVLGTPATEDLQSVQVRKKTAKAKSRFGKGIRTRTTATQGQRSVEILNSFQGTEADEAAEALLAAEVEHCEKSKVSSTVIRKYQMSPTASIKDQRVPDVDISPRSFWRGDIDELLHAVISSQSE